MNKYIVFFFFPLLLLSCTNKEQENKSFSRSDAARQNACTPPKVTILDSLPDSLQPKIVKLEKEPKPLTVTVPLHSGGSFSFTDSKGEARKMKLEPPVNKLLPVLQNEKGEPIKDAAGKPFIMGNGGLSNFTNFTTDNGLALDGVSCSFMDKSGNLWFGTDGGGVSRYDGKSFTTFSSAQGLANNIVYSIAEDKKGNLWFGTYGGGVSRYEGVSFVTFSTAQGLANNFVYSILADKKGNLWFGTYGGGVSRYDPPASPRAGSQLFTNFSTGQGLANNIVYCIAEDKKGNLWFGTKGGGVSCYDGKSFTNFSTAQGLANNTVFSIIQDKA